MSKKGFSEILAYIGEAGNVHYNDVLRYALDRKIVRSRASITIILNGLTSMGLVERTVIDSKPIRTSYKINKRGKNILDFLRDLEDEIGR
jgi:DNA-binding HxlR family transcriptional regulator